MKTDIEIAQSVEMLPIEQIADAAGIDKSDIDLYGRYKAKISCDLAKRADMHRGKLILVTAMNPTVAGEGKTTMLVGLTDALRRIGKKAIVIFA